MGELLETMMERHGNACTEKGIEIGVEKGVAQERQADEQKRQRSARRLALRGFSSEEIAEILEADPVVVESWLVED